VAASVAAPVADLLVPQTAASVQESVVTVVVAAAAVAKTETLTI